MKDLQDTGSTWMELVLPETIVQISVGSETILFRSGSGHVWIAGQTKQFTNYALFDVFVKRRDSYHALLLFEDTMKKS